MLAGTNDFQIDINLDAYGTILSVQSNYAAMGSSGTFFGSATAKYTTSAPVLIPSDGGSPVAAVPEPATWAMMLLGFGMTGATIRRRKATAKARVRFA